MTDGPLLEALELFAAGHPDPVLLHDTQGKLRFRNEAARCALPGHSLGHVCPEPGLRVDPSCPLCLVPLVAREATPRRWYLTVPRGDDEESGDPYYFQVTLVPIVDRGGCCQGVLEFRRDERMTLALERYLIDEAERKEGEARERSEERDRSDEAAGALREALTSLRESQTELLYRDRLLGLGRLVAGVAHEMHTPLGALLSSVDLIARATGRLRGETTDPRQVAALLDGIAAASALIGDGARRIEHVLKTLRLHAHLDEAPLKVADLNAGLDSTLELLRYRLGDRIEVERCFETLPAVLCRPDAMNQVFMNLIVNAIQAIPDRGRIRLTSRRDGDDIEFGVADDGRGIDAETMPRIFDLGFTTKSKGEGSGIGLAISRRIIEEHGGSIRARSREQGGTEVIVRLPVGDRESRERE